MTDQPTVQSHSFELDPTQHLYIAIDASGSMNERMEGMRVPGIDDRDCTRREYVQARLRALMEFAPPSVDVSIMQFGASISTLEAYPSTVTRRSPLEATAAIEMVHADEALTNVAPMLLRAANSARPTQLIVVIDGPPTDLDQLEFAALKLVKETDKLTVYWLTLGDNDSIIEALTRCGVEGSSAPLEHVELSFAALPASETEATAALQSDAAPRLTQPSIPPTPNDEDREAQQRMASVELRNRLDALGEDAPQPHGTQVDETANTDPLPPKPEGTALPPEAAPAAEPDAAHPDAAKQPAPHRKPKHHR